MEEGRREGRLQGGRKESVMAINASESERKSRERGDANPTPRHQSCGWDQGAVWFGAYGATPRHTSCAAGVAAESAAAG